MSLSALALVLLGAAFHSLWNIAAKRAAAGGVVFVWLFGLVSVAAVAPLAGWAWFAHPEAPTPAMWVAVIASAAIHVAYSLVLQRGYRAAAFSIVYPVARGSGPLFSVAVAIALWGERPTMLGWIGVAAVLAGLFLCAGGADLFGRRTVGRQRTGVLWGLSTGLFIAGYTLIDGWAVKSLGMSAVLFYALALALRSVLLAPMALRQASEFRARWRDHRWAILTVGLLSPAAYILVLLAMQTAPVSYVAPVREISMLIGTLLGARLLQEAVKPAQMAGAAAMLPGVVALALA
jgi:drug/metabolite transporter (DMT)-like permease